MEHNNQKVSFVIPALNEERAIGKTVQNCFAIANELSLQYVEVIVIDDGSEDATARIAVENGARVLRHPVRAGYGYALKTGIHNAKYDTIIISDADGTYPISELPKMFAEYVKGFDMVVGARTGKYYEESTFKNGLRIVLRCLVEWASGQKIQDINSGFRIFSKSTVQPFFSHLCNTFSFTTSLTLAYMMSGYFVSYVPIHYSPRIGLSHVRLFPDTLKTLSYIVLQILYFNPLKIFYSLSFFCIMMSFLGFFFSLITKINLGYFLGIIGLLSAILIFALGLIAELVRQSSHGNTNVNKIK